MVSICRESAYVNFLTQEKSEGKKLIQDDIIYSSFPYFSYPINTIINQGHRCCFPFLLTCESLWCDIYQLILNQTHIGLYGLAAGTK